jgi:hypothetical protein
MFRRWAGSGARTVAACSSTTTSSDPAAPAAASPRVITPSSISPARARARRHPPWATGPPASGADGAAGATDREILGGRKIGDRGVPLDVSGFRPSVC